MTAEATPIGFQCGLCGDSFHGYGNNPAPLILDPEVRCCGDCDATLVIPTRMYLAVTGKTYGQMLNEIEEAKS